MNAIINICKQFQSAYYYFIIFPFYKILFNKIGAGTRILKPLKIEGYENIALGKKVVIGKFTWLASIPLTGKSANLEIHDGTVLGNFNHIYATRSIVIESKVLTADKVYISDNLHGYKNIDVPIMDQPIEQLLPVVIGEGSWLGENVCVFSASIGKHCVIGANSVVNKNIPDYCVAVGSPAKIVKRYHVEEKSWKKTDSMGNFII